MYVSSFLFLERDLDLDGSVSSQEVEIDGLLEVGGRGRNVLVLELDLAFSAPVVPGTNVAVEQIDRQDHVVEGGDVEGEGLVPDGVDAVLFGRGDLGAVVVVADEVILFE